jgi:hypothetical protein
MRRSIRNLLVGLLFSSPLLATSASAALVGSDNFESYPNGSQLNGQNGGSGFTGPYAVDSGFLASVIAENQSLSYSGGFVSIDGGSRAVSIADAAVSNQLISRPFASQSAVPVYFSFLYRTNNPTTSEDFVQIGLSDVATGEPKISIGSANNTTGNAPPATFFVRVPTGGAGSVDSGVTLQPDTTYFLVGKASKTGGSTTYNTIDLYLNPTTLTEPGTPTATNMATAGSGAGSVSSSAPPG